LLKAALGSTADLHLHTTYSDGQMSPDDLVELAAGRGLKIIAITDHNTTDGLAEAQAAAENHADIEVIPGVELTTRADGVHILGYFVNYGLAWFQTELARLRSSQRQSIRGTVRQLRDLGMHVTWRRVVELAGRGSAGRPHIALAMLEKGYVASTDEAFELYLGRNDSVLTEMVHNLTPAEAATMITRAGGLSVLAHPAYLADLESLVIELKGGGLVGMEVYCWGYDRETVTRLLEASRRHRLLPLGGSDFHGLEVTQGRLPGDVAVPLRPVRRFMALGRVERPWL